MTTPMVFKLPRARTDLIECWVYLALRNSRAADRFLEATEATFTALARRPNTGAPFEVENPRLRGLRFASVKRFRNYVTI